MLIILLSLFAFCLFDITTSERLSPTILLNDGNVIPHIGLGTFYPERDFDKVTDVVIKAIEIGYRSFDTSSLYGTEQFIGKAIKNVTARGIVEREDLFIISKFARLTNPEDVQSEIQATLKRLQLDYLDLYLVHHAFNVVSVNVITSENFDILAMWKQMVKVKHMGLTRSIGVANFNSSHINYILAHSDVRPAVNEIEVNPSITNLDLVAYCHKQRVAVIAYAPNAFSVARPINIFLEPFVNSSLIVKLARKYRKTSHQIILRYLIDRHVIPIPRSCNKRHLKENFDIFDFRLSRKEVYLINEYNHNEGVYTSVDRIEAILIDHYGESIQDVYDSLGVH